MKIAIHHKKGSFSERWIDYCKDNNISYKIVDAYHSDIISQLKDCDGFMWHHSHSYFKDVLSAKKTLFALEQSGIPVFPNFNTGWHFDDKVAQKYLLEAIQAPYIRSYVFYDKQEAINWANETSFPKVFKLKGGAGASNVKLVNSKQDAVNLIQTAFGQGFKQFDSIGYVKDSFKSYKSKQKDLVSFLKSTGRLILQPDYSKQQSREKGYIYFQDFVPNNSFDVRVIVTGDKAYGAKRFVRENDFRASGSGIKDYSREVIDIECIKTAFAVKERLNVQTVSYDFVFDEDNKPLIVEISYGFPTTWADECTGYWDANLNWYGGSFIPQYWMIENLLDTIKKSNEQ